MITRKVLNETSHIVSAATYSGKALMPVQASALDLIFKTLTCINDTGTDERIMDLSIEGNNTFGTHSGYETACVKKIAIVMGNIIDTAKNVVNPHCRAIVKEVEEVRKESALASVGLLGNIKLIEMPSILTDELFTQLLDPYKDTIPFVSSECYELSKRLAEDFTSAEIEDLIKTGSNLLDAKATEYLKDIISEARTIPDAIDTAQLSLPRSILYFLLLTGIQNEKTDKCSALMEDTALRALVAKLRAAIAGKIYRDTLAYDRSISNGEILAKVSFNDTDYLARNCLMVYGPNYREWIQNKGGSPEAALGFLSTHGNTSAIDRDLDLRNNPEKYSDIYTMKINQLKAKETLEDITLVRRVTRDYMATLIMGMEGVDKAAMQLRLTAALEHEYHGAKYLVQYVIKVVSRTLTEGSDVKDILLEIDNILHEMKEPDLDYALYIACIRLIARWLKSQIVSMSV